VSKFTFAWKHRDSRDWLSPTPNSHCCEQSYKNIIENGAVLLFPVIFFPQNLSQKSHYHLKNLYQLVKKKKKGFSHLLFKKKKNNKKHLPLHMA